VQKVIVWKTEVQTDIKPQRWTTKSILGISEHLPV
jgi:hypothetical protein